MIEVLQEPIAIIEKSSTAILFANSAFQCLFKFSFNESSPLTLCSLLSPVYLSCPFDDTPVVSYTVYEMQTVSGDLFRAILNLSPLYGTKYRLVTLHDLRSLERSKQEGLKILLAYSRTQIGLAKFVFSPSGPQPEVWIGLDFLDDPLSLLLQLGIYYMSTIQHRKGLFGPFPVKDYDELMALVYSYDIDIKSSGYDSFDHRLGTKLPSLIILIYPKHVEYALNREHIKNVLSSVISDTQFNNSSPSIIRGMLETIRTKIFDEYISYSQRTLEDKLNLIEHTILDYTKFSSLDDFFQHLLHIAKQVLSFRRFTAWQVDHSINALRLKCFFGYSNEIVGMTIPLSSDTRSIVARCVREGTPQNVGDVKNDPDYLEGDPEVRSELAVPIISPIYKSVVGVLNVESEILQHFTTEDVILLQSLADRSALFMEKEATETLFYAMSKLVKNLNELGEVNFNTVSKIVLEFVKETFNFKFFSILRANKSDNCLEVAVSIGYDDSVYDLKLSIDPPQGIVGHTVFENKTYNVGDVTQVDYYVPVDPKVRSELTVPISINNEIIGAINLESYVTNAFSITDQRILETIAAICAFSLKHAKN